MKAEHTIAKVHRFGAKCLKSVKRRILRRGTMMSLFDTIQENRNNPAMLKQVLTIIEERDSPFWTQHYQKELQLILYTRFLLANDFGLKQSLREDIHKVLDLDHELSRKIAKALAGRI